MWSPSLVGDTTRFYTLLLGWGECGHPHLLGYYQVLYIAAGLGRMWPPSLVGDTTRFYTLLLGWGECGHPHLLGIIPGFIHCCWVGVNVATLTCWGYDQVLYIAAELG